MFKKIVNFLNEVKIEFKKVTWSTREELIGSTTVVIVTTLILALFVGFIDALLSAAITIIFRIF
ncbi:MAG: preprotein translocase subunit SecE [Candidatus Omnitrophica bacterium]|nr:preprotein translocase subunit SecE [Candidatus Omnitrophota bacterium]